MNAHTGGGAPWRVPTGGAVVASTLSSDTGYEITNPPETDRQPFQVHWFTGVTHLSAEDTFKHVHEVTGASFLSLLHGRQGYRSAYQTPEFPGLTVLCDPGDPDNMPPVCLVVPGESCEALGWQRLQTLSAPFKPTRVDLAFDDFPFTPLEAKQLILSGSVRTRAQRHTVKYHEDYSNTLTGDVEPSHTVSLGGRGSSQFFRCYNSRGFDRGELELKGPLAEAAYELLQSPLHQAREMALSFMRRFLDFVDPDTDINKSRQALLPAWAVWLDSVQKAILDLPPRPVQTLQTLWDWSKRQLAPVLAVLNTSDPLGFTSLLDHGATRWTAKHRLLLGSG
jgi:hypothetical protein